MSDIAARGAVEIDRLVLGINRQVGSRHGADLMTEAAGQGVGFVTALKPARQIVYDLVEEALETFETVGVSLDG